LEDGAEFVAAGPEEKPADTPKGNESPQNKKHDAFEQATLATAIVGVVILVVYTAITGYQAYIAKDTAERQLRAYVSVIVEKHPDFNGQGPIEAVLLFKNTGQTPAFKVRARSVFSVAGGNTLSDAEIGEIRDYMARMKGHESVMFPGQEFRQSAEPGTGLTLTSDQKISVSMGAATFWVNGEVNYTDAFGYPHFTRFRLFMNGAAGFRYNKLIWAEQGNDAN
jgi:hypothetical protein